MHGSVDKDIEVWYGRLYRTALRMTGSYEAAADLTQQAFCNAFDKWDTYNGGGKRTTWLHSILVNCVRDWFRAKGNKSGGSLDEWCTDVAAKGPKHVIETIEQQEKHAFLHEAIKELPEILKPAFVVTVLDGFTYQEASEILEVPIGTVASRVYEARKILQTIMLKRFPEE